MSLYWEVSVQTRLVSCLAGGLLGFAFTTTINDSVGLSPTAAFIVFPSVGVALGYAISMLFHVFTAKS